MRRSGNWALIPGALFFCLKLENNKLTFYGRGLDRVRR